jgi:hypothetical protein
MTNLRRLAALSPLPFSALFIVPGISEAQHAPTAEHPTDTAQRRESTVVTHALFIRLEAKPGKENELAQFLHTGLDLARQARLSGPIVQALGANAPNLLAQASSIERIDVLGTKLP